MSVWQELYHSVLTETFLVCTGVSTVLSNISDIYIWRELHPPGVMKPSVTFLTAWKIISSIFSAPQPSSLSSPMHFKSHFQEASPRQLFLCCQAYSDFPPATFLIHRVAHRSCFRSVLGKKLKAWPMVQCKPRLLLLTSGSCRHRQGRNLGLVPNATFEIIQTQVTRDVQLCWDFSQ